MVEETCGGEMCRDCHVSLTFEECVDGTYDVGNLQTLGHSDEELQGLYPDAQQWKKAR